MFACVQTFQKQAETDIRGCCLTEIKQTEEKYTETLESIEKVRTDNQSVILVRTLSLVVAPFVFTFLCVHIYDSKNTGE